MSLFTVMASMRGLVHVLAILLALPQVLLCAAVLLLGHITGGRTLGTLLKRSLDVFFAAFSWGGLLGLVSLLVLITAGFSVRARRAAAAIVAVIVIATTATLLVKLGFEYDALFLFVPGLYALVLSIALTS